MSNIKCTLLIIKEKKYHECTDKKAQNVEYIYVRKDTNYKNINIYTRK